MTRRPRSIRFTFDNSDTQRLRLVDAKACQTLAPASHDRGNRRGITGFWVQLESATGAVLYRRDIPGMMLPLDCGCSAAASLENGAGEFARFDVVVPYRPDAASVAIFAPPRRADGRRPHLGRPSELIGRFPLPEPKCADASAGAVTLPADICGSGRGEVLSVIQAVNHGRIHNIHTLVILAEAFLVDQQDDFVAKARDCIDFLLSRPPFNSELGSQAMNVFIVPVASNVGAIDNPNGTYFAVQRKGGTTLSWDTACVTKVCDALFSEGGQPYWTWAALIVNESSDRVGTARGPQFATGLTDGYELIFQHEFGHSAFALGDEYDGEKGPYEGNEPNNANLTKVTTREGLKWLRFVTEGVPIPTLGNPSDCSKPDNRKNPVDDSAVGLYAGGRGYSCGIFHPQYVCVMNSDTVADGAFCAVCLHEGKKVLASSFPLHVPAPGSIYYSPITRSWSHAVVAANVIETYADLEDYADFNAVVNELLAGTAGTAVRGAFSAVGHPLPSFVHVHQSYYDAGEQTGVWYLIDPTNKDTYFVHAFTVEIDTVLQMGRIALPDFPSLSTFDGAVVGIEVLLFAVEGHQLALGRLDSSGNLVGGTLEVQSVRGLSSDLSSVSVSLLGSRIWVAAVDALRVKIAAYELQTSGWWGSGFVAMPTGEPTDFHLVRIVEAGNLIHVLALASGGLVHGVFDTMAGAWRGEATQTPIVGNIAFYDVASDGQFLYVVTVTSAGTFMYRYSISEDSWSAPTAIGADLGLAADSVISALAVTAFKSTLHVVALVNQRPEHAMYDLNKKTWTQPLTVIAPLKPLAADVSAMALHATPTQVYLALSETLMDPNAPRLNGQANGTRAAERQETEGSRR